VSANSFPFRTNFISGKFDKSSQLMSNFDNMTLIIAEGPAINDVPVSIAIPH